MGQVYRAFDSTTQRVVALKLLPPQLAADTAFRERFRREAFAAARLTDPHVVPIHSFGEIDGRLYVDMRLIDGRDLGEIIRHTGCIDPVQTVYLIQQVASALDAAHHSGLVHRDVKPSNILVTPNDFVYLIDFGIARAVQETGLTGTGQTLGTLAYMAPERFTTGAVDTRSDVYSLACVLFECLTGRQPFPGDNAEQKLAGHLMSAPPRPTTIVGHLPPAVDHVIEKGMAKDPSMRYQTAPDLAVAAGSALQGGGVGLPLPSSNPASTEYPPWSPTEFAQPPTQFATPPLQAAPRRRRRMALVGALAGTALIIAGTVTAVLVTSDRSGTAQVASPSNSTTVPPSASAPESPYGEPVRMPFGRLPEPPRGIAVAPNGDVYVTLNIAGQILKLPAGKEVPTQIPANGIEFGWGIAVDETNRVIVANNDPRGSSVVRLLDGGAAEPLPFTGLKAPIGVAVDPSGSVYVADQTGGDVLMLQASSGQQVRAPFHDIRAPSFIAVDQVGNLFLTQAGVGVLKLTANSARQEVLPFTGLDTPSAVAVDNDQNVYVSDYVTGKVLRLDMKTNEQADLPFTDLVKPQALAADDQGNVYVSDERNRVLRLSSR